MIKRETKDKKSSEWKDKKTPKNAELQGHRVPPEQKRIERKGGKQRRCGGGENTEGMLINKILFLDECRDAGLPLLRALSNLWDGSNKARLCGWEAREGEKIFWRSAPQWATTKQQAGYPAPPPPSSLFDSLSNNTLGSNSGVRWSIHRCQETKWIPGTCRSYRWSSAEGSSLLRRQKLLTGLKETSWD